MKLTLILIAFVASLAGCAQSQKPVTVLNTAAYAPVEAESEPVEPIVIITKTTVSAVNCKDIMYFFRTLPMQEVLSRPGLLEQVADCNR